MTAIVGMLCTDGVVVGSDSSATFVNAETPTIEQPFEKINIIQGEVILVGTGQVGLGQRFHEVVAATWKEKRGDTGIEAAKTLCSNGIKDFQETGVQPGRYGALVAFPLKNQPHLCEFATSDFQPEMKTLGKIWYCSMGSGQRITDPFLAFMRSIFWSGDKKPNVKEGVFATAWALDHVIECNPGGVGGPASIAVLESPRRNTWKARSVEPDELKEAREHIDDAKSRLRASVAPVPPDSKRPIPAPKNK